MNMKAFVRCEIKSPISFNENLLYSYKFYWIKLVSSNNEIILEYPICVLIIYVTSTE